MITPIKTGLCSFGSSGEVFHAPLISCSEGFELHAVVERHSDRAIAKYPSIKHYKDVQELFDDPELELIVVNTPNNTHFDFAARALKAGKHVLIEKPFSNSVEEGNELINLAKVRHKVLTVFHNRRWDGDFKIIKEVIDNGVLGRLVDAEFRFERYRRTLNVKKHKELIGPGSGLLYELGTHIFDQALVLFGKPETVFADIRTTRDNSLIDDYFDVLFFYPRFRLRLRSSMLVKEEGPGYVLNGTMGSFRKNRMNLQEDSLKAGMLPTDEGYGIEPKKQWGLLNAEINGKQVRKHLKTPPSNYMDFYNALYESIREGKKAPIEPQDALLGIELIEACYQSQHEKRIIAIR
ncbi:Gfo/Idh/MocA family oxidoreductase [Solitalea koreensis]|uniref:Predicted dehydrogenase n=1 Tax=Solitalea koreensis TaxID=543615 RepID=A0A521E7G5_9SPHI|nr:Gfo/Idh/MocA family oxidoreductase [Solitalea koreensis]SMO79893.1 Predicted dehydrogenase [Solitalea koreensis]